MKEKLIIKNFGPIKSVELDLGRFTILIGEQATGKSTVAKVLAVCRYFSYIVGGAILPPMDTFRSGLKAWGLLEYTKNSYIYYECRDYSLTYNYWLDIPYTGWNEGDDKPTEYTKDEYELEITPLSQEFKNLLAELEKINPKDGRIPTSFYRNDVKNVMDNPFYLPTERGLQSIFSLGQESIPNLANFLFNYYSKVDGILKSFKTETEIEPLDIFYINRNGIGYIRKKDEQKFYLLANAASGYQSTIPAILVMKYYELQKRKKTFIIEEPELNIFPDAQNKLLQYISDISKIHDSMVLMTTHSPYTLTSVNNLIYAYQVGQTNPEKVSKEIDKKYWLNPDDISVYMMKTDGIVENIIDEDGLIKAEKIDEVSKAINKKFNAIMDIELGVDETTK